MPVFASMLRRTLISALVFFLGFTAVRVSAVDDTCTLALRDLDAVRNLVEAQYAPKGWKQAQFGWTLEAAHAKAKREVLAQPNLTVLEYHRILGSFLSSMADYHVSVSYVTSERSTLPFMVRSAQGKFFIVHIDRTKLPESTFPFKEGDELVIFDGKPVQEIVDQIRKEWTTNVGITDQALAEMYLTKRRPGRGPVSQGPITVWIKGKFGIIQSQELFWEHTGMTPVEPGRRPVKSSSDVKSNPLLNRLVEVSFKKELEGSDASNHFDLGARQSYMPALGEKTWETSADNPFHAYIFKAADGRMMGYVRIPSYTPEDADKAVVAFREIIQKLEAETEGLVIDQLNNPGGSVFYLYTLASMLTKQALETPLHQMAITQADVMEAQNLLDQLQSVKTDADARTVLGETFGGYPVSYQMVLFIRGYAELIISEWQAGNVLTKPSYLYGVNKINPDKVHYTKPILFLTNELDFSGGDFMPAILQDNHAARIMGVRTAGAGGYVLENISHSNRLGVSAIRLTGSIAVRKNGQPIENLGVTPDVAYELTADDFQKNFEGYKSAVLETLSNLLK